MTTIIENLDDLHAIYERVVDKGPWTTLVVHNRWMTLQMIDSDEDGQLFYQRVQTDDPEDVPNGYIDGVPGVDTGWPLTLVFPDIEGEPEPCTVQFWSWDYFRTEQVDPYWMRCDATGVHDEHRNSETGAKWPSPALPVPNESESAGV